MRFMKLGARMGSRQGVGANVDFDFVLLPCRQLFCSSKEQRPACFTEANHGTR